MRDRPIEYLIHPFRIGTTTAWWDPSAQTYVYAIWLPMKTRLPSCKEVYLTGLAGGGIEE